jgi:type I restriction enzyme S subunit
MSYGAFMAIFRSEFNSAIYYFLISPFFRNIIDNDVGTTTINQVTQAIIKNLPYPLAPEAEMEEIVRILDVLINKERQALAAAEAVLSQIDTMKKTILARAFRGELGTNDPKEEWAGELVKKAL